ncbi:GNAT family N-acetyltransferase [Clostridium felsineum]|uniref:Phosphinothricin acetyltransferase YwnH n=1 Tax=Clostridium felsineum TaxID=36839 RepID=A0A1S8MF52_9CLOT|nr:GNAT family N-acetyltransferase [Clostridium felsineum]URZ09192.1 Putative phosphinothricin acetyltransferase YwnH [Clostridium felsineum]URZ13878.1 Putative phosphinothricin acetyltransferase YwnH [Clostridium felsineum]
MDYNIREMKAEDWEAVAKIYSEGIDTGKATFQSELPNFEEWDKGHMKNCRIVACDGENILGWAALSPTSSRCVYKGVAEVSIYIGEAYRGKGVGKNILNTLVKLSEENGLWTLQSGIIKENTSSIALHRRCGFRDIGIREKIAKMPNGTWHDTVLMERRSTFIGIS